MRITEIKLMTSLVVNNANGKIPTARLMAWGKKFLVDCSNSNQNRLLMVFWALRFC